MAKDDPKMFNLRINSGEDASDKGDVVVVHNFKQYVIQRDVDVKVPECIISTLNDAVINTIVKDDDGTEKPVRIARFSFNHSPA